MTATWSVKSRLASVSPRIVLCLALAVGMLGACNGGGGASACGDPEPQRIDPRSSQHLLPGAPEPRYNTNPPTSGAHRPGPIPDNVLTSPMPKPEQVALLEAGHVLVQYRSAADGRALRSVARAETHIAPGSGLPAPVVATAWLWMMRCDSVDKSAIEKFVDAHAQQHASD